MAYCEDCATLFLLHPGPYVCQACTKRRQLELNAAGRPYGWCLCSDMTLVGIDVLARCGVEVRPDKVFATEEDARAHAATCVWFYKRVLERQGEAAYWSVSLDGIELPFQLAYSPELHPTLATGPWRKVERPHGRINRARRR